MLPDDTRVKREPLKIGKKIPGYPRVLFAAILGGYPGTRFTAGYPGNYVSIMLGPEYCNEHIIRAGRSGGV